MSLRGSRRTQVVLAAVGVVAAVVVALVVVAPWDGDPWDAPVGESAVDGFPSRGSLAEDGGLVEAAADAWRSGDSLDVRTKPEFAIELLWAGEVDKDVLEDELYTDDETPDRLPVVVLRSGYDLATFVVERDGDDVEDVNGLGIRKLSTYPSPIIEVPGSLALAASGLPDSFEAADLDGSELTAVSDDGLISPTESDSFLALRLDSARLPSRGATPGVYVEGRVVSVDPDDVDRIWGLLIDPARATAVRSGLSEAVGPRSNQEGGRLELPEVDIVAELVSPRGDPVLVLEAAGTGARWSRAVVAVESGPPGSQLAVTRLGSDESTGPWVGSAWITSDEAAPYLVVAGGDGTERIEARAATTSTEVAGAGVVVPTVVSTDNSLPDVVIAGFTGDGTVVAAMAMP